MSELFEQILSVISSRVVHSHHHPGGHDHGYRSVVSSPGYWGNPSATVDWCEPNYQYSDYIAEFFNTVSSFAMVFTGVVGTIVHMGKLEWRFIISFASVALVGIGSAAFHGTLLFTLQMLDELPMIYTSLMLAYCVLQNEHVKERYYPALPIGLFVHGVITTALVASPALAPQYASPLLQFVCFHVSFGVLELFLLSKTTQLWRMETDPSMQRAHAGGFILWGLGIVFWILDYAGCETLFEGDKSWRRLFLSWQVNLADYPWMSSLAIPMSESPGMAEISMPNPQLHAWWHICASSGLYLMSLVVAHRRCQVLGKEAHIKTYLGVPYVHVTGRRVKPAVSREATASPAEQTSSPPKRQSAARKRIPAAANVTGNSDVEVPEHSAPVNSPLAEKRGRGRRSGR